MNICIWTETLPAEYHWRPEHPVRGTEEFYVRTAEELARRGHYVDVIYDGPTTYHQTLNLAFLDRPRTGLRPGYDVLLYCNDTVETFDVWFGGCPALRIRWTNKYGERYTPAHDSFAFVVGISEFQRSTFGPSMKVVGHGCDPMPTGVKRNQACFTSSPDRGLDFLQSIWPRVQDETGVRLRWADGQMSNDVVNALYAESLYWLHPGLGVELFCLSALKAQAAGCIPCVVPHMALAETVKYGLKTSLDRYERDLIAFFKSDPKPEPFTAPTWAQVTAQLAALWECK